MMNDDVLYIKPCYSFLVVEEIIRENIEQLTEKLVEKGKLFLRIYETIL